MKLTKAIVYAAAFDAAERNKRKRRVKITDDEAAEAFQNEFDRLFAFIGKEDGWIELPSK